MLKQCTIPAGQGFYLDYLKRLPQAVEFLDGYFTDGPDIIDKCEKIACEYQQNRQQITDVLLTYNRHIGCTEETEKQIKKLLHPQAVAVLCGQQAGLLSGPLYTVYKALAAVKMAAKLEAQLQRPVVPIFWIASEDNDFSEVNHCYVSGRDNKPQRLELPLQHEGEPVGRLNLTGAAGLAVLEELRSVLPETEFIPELMQWLDETRQSSTTPVEWFARIMMNLFSRQGLIFYDPLLTEGRKLAAPLIQKAVRLRESIQDKLRQREKELMAAGYQLQVQREADSTLLMIMKNRRTALFYKNGVYQTRDATIAYHEHELATLALEQFDLLSPNVLLRPLVQDYLFPTVAVVLGPGETAYFAQAMVLYPLFGREQPVIVPRPGLTVVEPRLARHIKRYQIPEGMLLHSLSSYLEQLVREKSDVNLDLLFDHLRKQVAKEYEQLKGSLSLLNPQLNDLTDKNLQHVYSQIGFLEEKARLELGKKHEVMIRHFAQLQEGFLPLDKPQERVLTIFSFWAKYGPDWWEQLVAEFPVEGTHYLYYQK